MKMFSVKLKKPLYSASLNHNKTVTKNLKGEKTVGFVDTFDFYYHFCCHFYYYISFYFWSFFHLDSETVKGFESEI